jgi:hypothetical protein
MSVIQQLRDEIALRRASLADLEREVAAGELDAAGYDRRRANEEAALAHLERTLAVAEADALIAADEAQREHRPRRRRTSLLVVALTCFLVAAGTILAHSLSVRQPGQSATGSISTTQRQQVRQLLGEGEADIANNNETAAIAAYDSVLLIDPANVEALTESGWLHFSAGAASHDVAAVNRGAQLLARAVNTARTNPAPRLYYAATLTLTPGHTREAAYQFRVFLTLHPTAAQLAVARPFMAQVGVAG